MPRCFLGGGGQPPSVGGAWSRRRRSLVSSNYHSFGGQTVLDVLFWTIPSLFSIFPFWPYELFHCHLHVQAWLLRATADEFSLWAGAFSSLQVLVIRRMIGRPWVHCLSPPSFRQLPSMDLRETDVTTRVPRQGSKDQRCMHQFRSNPCYRYICAWTWKDLRSLDSLRWYFPGMLYLYLYLYIRINTSFVIFTYSYRPRKGCIYTVRRHLFSQTAFCTACHGPRVPALLGEDNLCIFHSLWGLSQFSDRSLPVSSAAIWRRHSLLGSPMGHRLPWGQSDTKFYWTVRPDMAKQDRCRTRGTWSRTRAQQSPRSNFYLVWVAKADA